MSWIVRHPVLTALLSAAVAASAGFAGDIVFHRTWLIVACAAVAQLALTVHGSVRADAAAQMPPRVLTVGLALAALAGVTVVVAATGWTRWWLYLSLGPVLNLLLPATVDELDDRAGAGRRRVAGTRAERRRWRLLHRCQATIGRAQRLAYRRRYARARRRYLRAERALCRRLGAGDQLVISCRLAAATLLA
ncbi:hypothetical protein [Actinocatenispora rupis]|uniref:Uncharacterized protein n=1 Tax=Actinocatenispora rupis TaxID=519421 RepID=A0A8J3JH53_9ACTN|nr:hypothetical protein [Actinocatenispora rupis]GID16302.1 hypothetical protein Aru02nite_71910 [Actinocatenispora rupis]